MAHKLETYQGFNPDQIADYFRERGWPISFVSLNEVNLVPVDVGAALECSDGRFDHCQERRMRGPRVLGGINVVMAMLTGGGEEGFRAASERVKMLGFAPGTHSAHGGDCGYFYLWEKGKLNSAEHAYIPHYDEQARQLGLKTGQLLKMHLRSSGGWHFKLNGEHKEQAVRLNPYRGTTEGSGNGERFRLDEWFLADLGIPPERRWLLYAESIEQLKQDATKLEIINL